MNHEETAAYPCGEFDLYPVLLSAHASYVMYQPQLFGYKNKYDAAFGDDLLKAINNAKNLPNEQQREADIETLHGQMAAQTLVIGGMQRRLKGYIIDAFPDKVEQKARLGEAGFGDYEKAMNKQWNFVTAMTGSSTPFIHLHAALLKSKGSMPDAFEGQYNAEAEKFNNMVAAVVQAEKDAKSGQQDKVKLNNLAYNTTIAMFKDAQVVFEDNVTIREEFVFEQVLEKVGEKKLTGFKGHILDEATGFGIPNVKLTSTDGKYTTETNESGHFDFKQITGGVHKFKIEKDGYISQIIEINLETGVTKTVTYKLIKA